MAGNSRLAKSPELIVRVRPLPPMEMEILGIAPHHGIPFKAMQPYHPSMKPISTPPNHNPQINVDAPYFKVSLLYASVRKSSS
jgi:hypothetical protein